MKAYLRPYPVQRQQRRAFMLMKAVQHKYLSKHKKNGRWVYVYPKKGSGNRHSDTHQADRTRHVPGDDQIHAGSSFSAGSGKGHYQVESVTDGKVTFHLDDEGGKKGKSQTMSLADFKATVAGAHKDAHDRHATEGLKARQDILKRAELFGTEKQKARAKAEVERWQKKHFPEEKSPPSEGGSSAPHDIGAIKKHFKLWEKGNHRRAYLSAKALKEAGAEISYYKSGNLSSFKFNGEKLSNADGRRILHSGMYYDLNKGEWELGGMNKREFSHIAQGIIDTFSHKEEVKGNPSASEQIASSADGGAGKEGSDGVGRDSPASELKAQYIKVQTKDGPKRRKAQVLGGYAVHKAEGAKGYVVTHTATGVSIPLPYRPYGMRTMSQDEAVQYMRHLHNEAPNALASAKFGTVPSGKSHKQELDHLHRAREAFPGFHSP